MFLLGRLRFALAPTQKIRHILTALKMLRIFLFGLLKRRKPRTIVDTADQKLVGKHGDNQAYFVR
jgi:hypothetical protein